jgi:hypothetical protein
MPYDQLRLSDLKSISRIPRRYNFSLYQKINYMHFVLVYYTNIIKQNSRRPALMDEMKKKVKKCF